MNFIRKENEGTTRREFAKSLAAGTTALAASGSVHALNAASTAPPQRTKETKYGKWIKPFVFQEWQGPYRYYTKHVSEFPNLTIEYGVPAIAGRIGGETSEVHDFNQVMVFIGSDMFHVTDLNADVEFCIGPEKESHLLTASRPVLIPKGLPHLPVTIEAMDKPFIVMTVSQTSEVKSTSVPAGKEDSPILADRRSKYRSSFPELEWVRKGRGHYGRDNLDDAGGLRNNHGWTEPFSFSLSYQNIMKGPYRFGYDPYNTHVHDHDEQLLFIGTDPNDLTQLGGECVMCMGPEMEKHVISAPTLVHLPKGFPHCPTYVTRVDRPFIFSMFYAFYA
jgi:hypothetical protein